jgi:hypothetical protein
MIETEKYSQSPKTYFNIVLKTRIKKRGWLYGLIILLGLIHLYLYLINDVESSIVWAIFCFLYPLFIYIYLYRFSYSKDQREFLDEKQLFFDAEKIKIVENDGGQGEFPYSRINRVKTEKDFWMLYISKSQFIYVPKNIFYTEADCKEFEQNILNQ